MYKLCLIIILHFTVYSACKSKPYGSESSDVLSISKCSLYDSALQCFISSLKTQGYSGNEGELIKSFHSHFCSITNEKELYSALVLPEENLRQFLASVHSSDCYNDIWECVKAIDYKSKDTVYHSYFNLKGEFFKNLIVKSKNNPFITAYTENLAGTGGLIPPSLVAGIPSSINEKELEIIEVRYLLALHYITISMEYYTNNKSSLFNCNLR